VVCATVGPGGRPHLAALWYLPTGGRLDCWTYAASQKVRNLVRDPGQVLDLGVALAVRHGGRPGPDLRAGLAAQAAKRVGIRFHPTRVSSWDHRKLG
jgi:hypothetical protein